jgi:hypothetical protein
MLFTSFGAILSPCEPLDVSLFVMPVIIYPVYTVVPRGFMSYCFNKVERGYKKTFDTAPAIPFIRRAPRVIASAKYVLIARALRRRYPMVKCPLD